MVKIFRPPSPAADDERYAVVTVPGGLVELNDGAALWFETEVPADWIEMVPGQAPPTPILVRDIGVHETHCCPKCGCSYGAVNCPIAAGTLTPRYGEDNGCECCESERTGS